MSDPLISSRTLHLLPRRSPRVTKRHVSLSLQIPKIPPLLIYITRVFTHRNKATKKKPNLKQNPKSTRDQKTLEQSSMASDGSDKFRLVSPTISNEGRLPRHYTGEGQGAKKNISPPLEWYNLPEGTKSLALVVEDIDAPDPNEPIVPWTHWVVVNIQPTIKGLPEGFSGKEGQLGGEYAGIKEGINDLKVPGWHVPVLPTHGHRIEFKLYALDDELPLGNKVTKDKLLDSLEGHVLGVATLMAKF